MYFQPNAMPDPYGGPFLSPEQRHRQKQYSKSIVRTGNSLGTTLLLVQVFGTAVILLLPKIVAAVFPFASTKDVFYEALEYAIYSPIALMLAAVVGAWISKNRVRELIPFEPFSLSEGVGCMLLCFWGILIGNYLTNILSTLVPRVQETYDMISGPDPSTPLELTLNLLQTAAIPALVEEFAFRGVMLGMLRRYGDGFAIVVSSLLFGVIHGNFVQMPFAFFVGLAFGYTVVRTGSLVPVVIIHFINNATSDLLVYFQPQLNALLGEYYMVYLFGAWFVLGGIGLMTLVLFSNKGFSACLRPYVGCISPTRRTVSLVRAPVLILAVLYYFFNALMILNLPLGG